jgi:nicotinate phosphoribosyltransferase
LLVPFFRAGQVVYEPPAAFEARRRALSQVRQLDQRFTRLSNPEVYPSGLELGLFDMKQQIVARIKQGEMQRTR